MSQQTSLPIAGFFMQHSGMPYVDNMNFNPEYKQTSQIYYKGVKKIQSFDNFTDISQQVPMKMNHFKKVLSTDNFIPTEPEYELNPQLFINHDPSQQRMTYAEAYQAKSMNMLKKKDYR